MKKKNYKMYFENHYIEFCHELKMLFWIHNYYFKFIVIISSRTDSYQNKSCQDKQVHQSQYHNFYTNTDTHLYNTDKYLLKSCSQMHVLMHPKLDNPSWKIIHLGLEEFNLTQTPLCVLMQFNCSKDKNFPLILYLVKKSGIFKAQ